MRRGPFIWFQTRNSGFASELNAFGLIEDDYKEEGLILNILIKNTFRSVESNRGQVFVIVLTIMIVTAMIFISFSMFDIFYNLNMAEYDRIAQGSEMLLGDNLGSNEFFSEARVRGQIDPNDLEHAFYFAKFNTILKTETNTITVLLEATDLTSYFEERPLNYVDKFSDTTTNPDIDYRLLGGYNTIIVGESFAGKNDIRVGQLVEVYVPTYNKYVKMIVEYIALNEGIFSSPADMNILVDFSGIGNQGQVNAVYLDFKSADLYDKYFSIFEEEFPAIRLGEGNSYSKVIQIVKNNTMLLTVGLVFLVATMMLILVTSYLIVARNRVAEMTIFKAAGATAGQVILIMSLEVLLYAFCGGLLGLLLGRAAMGLAAYVLIPLVQQSVNYAFWKYIAAFSISLIVSYIGAIFPIISVAKKSIRQLISNSNKSAKNVKLSLFIISSVSLLGLTIAYSLMKDIYLLVIAPLLVIALILWLYSATSFVIRLFGYLGKKISGTGLLYMSGLSVKRNKAIRTVILMISVITVFTFLVFQVLDIVNYAVVPFRSRYNADFIVVNNERDFTIQEEIKENVDGLSGVETSGYFNSVNFIVPGTEEKEWTIYGVDRFETLKMCANFEDSSILDRWDNNENAIILSNDMLIRLDLEIGDIIYSNPIRTDYDDVIYEFIVVGVDYTITEYDRIGYCRYNQIDHMSQETIFLVKAEEDASYENTFVSLRAEIEKFSLKNCYSLTFKEWALAKHENLSGVSLLIQILQIVFYFVGIVGILNLSIVTAYDRRNEIKLYKISGMSNSDYVKFSFFEGLVIALSGSSLGLIISYVINLILPAFASVIDKYIGVNYVPYNLLLIFGVSFAMFTGVWTVIGAINRKRKITSINERILE